MPTAPISGTGAWVAEPRRFTLAALCLAGLLAGCAAQRPAPPVVATNPTPLTFGKSTPPARLTDTVAALAAALVAQAKLPPNSGQYPVTIDLWIDARTGNQVETTRVMEAEIKTLIQQHFSAARAASLHVRDPGAQTLVLVGAIAPVAGPGSFDRAAGRPGAYRIYGVIANSRPARSPPRKACGWRRTKST